MLTKIIAVDNTEAGIKAIADYKAGLDNADIGYIEGYLFGKIQLEVPEVLAERAISICNEIDLG